MAVTIAADGFTDYQSSGTTYYVSASGSNANAGTSEGAPFATIAHAYAQMTTGTGARALLKRGDTFSVSDLNWVKSGASSTDFMVLGAYGTLTDARPIVQCGGSQGIGVDDTTVRYVAFQSLDFRTTGAAYALSYLFREQGTSKALEHIHVEDCRFDSFYRGMRWQTDEPTGGVIPPNPTPATNCKLRRNTFELCDIGFYSSMLHTADVHDNIYLGCGSNYQEHGCYFDDSRYTGSQPDIDYRRNIAMGDNRGCGEGHKIRCVSNAGAVVDNFAARCGIGIAVGSGGETNGGGTGMDPWYALRVNLTDNWITEGVNQKFFDGSAKPMGQGIWLIWLSGTSSDIQRNIVTDMGGGYRAGITMTNGPSNGLNISNNTLFQSGGSGGAAIYSLQNGATITNCIVSSNRLRDLGNTALIVQDVTGTFVPTVRGGNTFFSTASDAGMVISAGTLGQYGARVGNINLNFTGAKPTITTFLASIGIIGDYTTLRNMLALQRRGRWDTRIEATRINDHARAWAGYPALATGAANVPPTANAGTDATVTDSDRDADVVATLDLTGSTDGDGTISTYIVREGPTTLYSGSDSTPDVTLGLGLHTLTVTCVDDDGATSNPDTVVITGKPGTLASPTNTPSVESTTISVAAYTGVNYEWQYGTATATYAPSVTTNEPFLNVGEIGSSVTVYWRARAVAGGVPGDWLAEQTATTGAAVALAPTAVMLTPVEAQQDLGRAGVLDVRLDGSVSSDGDGTVVAWTWFEDPGSPISTSESSLVPLSIGRHVITLIVTDDDDNDSIPVTGTFDVQPTSPSGVGSLPRSGAATLFVQSYPRATGYRFQYGATEALGTTVDSAAPSIDIAATGKVYWKAAALAGPIIGLYTSIQETLPIVTELHPPIAVAGSDITDTDTDNTGFESVTLDGSASIDNGNDITAWYWVQDSVVLSSDSATFALNAPVGITSAFLTVQDSQGSISADADEVQISVTPAQVASLTLIPGDSKIVAAWAIVNGSGIVYEVEANDASDFSGTAVTLETTDNGAVINGLTNATLYYVRVRAVCDTLNGAWSTSQSETPEERDTPTPPSKTFYARKERLFKLLRIGRL